MTRTCQSEEQAGEAGEEDTPGMDFAAVRSIRRGKSDAFRHSAAEVVNNANPSVLLDNTSGRVAEVARDTAAAVVALMRRAGNRELCRSQAGKEGEAYLWEALDAGLLDVQATLARSSVPSQIFQARLLLALQHGGPLRCERKGAGVGGRRGSSSAAALRERPGEHPPLALERPPLALALYWRLHELAILPLSRLLEANEALPSPRALGRRQGGEDQRRFCGGRQEDFLDVIVQDMRALAVYYGHENADSQREGAVLVSEVAKHLFDLAYRKGPLGSGGLTAGNNTTDALSSRAARMVLDQLCCGPDVFSHSTKSRVEGTEAKLRGCLSVLAAIASVVAPEASLTRDSASTALVNATAGTMERDEGVHSVTRSPIGQDESTSVFLTRQLRLLMENSSGQSEFVQGEHCVEFEAAEMAGVHNDANSRLLVAILRYFPPTPIIEALRSICRRSCVKAADTKGLLLHKPLLRWETLGPIVRAAATAHPQEVPPAVASIGTELAAAAVNSVPSADGNVGRATGYNQQQGVLVLSTAFRLVAEADICSQGNTHKGAGEGGGGLYAQWFRTCFGVDAGTAQAVGLAEARPVLAGHGQHGTRTSEPQGDGSGISASEAVREVMKKQRATEILMETLSLSVPYDPGFVLEVHKDVLTTRLRANFSVQVRDFIDLVVTRLSDLKGRDEDKRRRGGEEGRYRTPGVEGSSSGEAAVQGEYCGDPTTREVGFFLRQFKQTGKVPEALRSVIVFQPRSWARLRKVLLAPPAERIAIPDENDKMPPPDGAVVKEAIGHSEGGLRVEVSLKYRRLLVQKLAQSSLLTAQEHESFRKSYVEYLQDQRHQADAESKKNNKEAAVTGVARQLLRLESTLVQSGSGTVGKGDNRSSTVEERLALLLQEFLPRALVVELCMDDEGDAGYRREPPSTHGRAWFARAIHLLQQILEEWKQQRFPATGGGGGSLGLGASPEEVAEVILNSVHCCVAAVGASLAHPTIVELDSATRQPDFVGQVVGNGARREGSSGTMDEGEAPAVVGLPAAHAFRRVGEVVGVAAGFEPLGGAVFRRCSSLLSNPNLLDSRQLLSLTYSLVGLPAAFHLRVEGFLASLVGKIFLPRNNSCGSGHTKSPAGGPAGLAATAQVGALYLQSSLFLHEHVWEKSLTENIDNASSARAVALEHHNSRTGGRLSDPARDGGDGNVERVGLAPVALLELCWWMERRLSIAQQQQQRSTTTALERSHGCCLAGELAVLLRLLRSVVKHPLMERTLKRAFGGRAPTMPPLERLVALELAASGEKGFGGASITLALLENVTLDRLVVDHLSNDAERLQAGSSSTDEAEVAWRPRKTSRSGIVEKVLDVWKDCAGCLFGSPSLLDAARSRVSRSTESGLSEGRGIGSESVAHTWESHSHNSWRNMDGRCRLTSDAVAGVEALLDSILQVMGKLCSLEATSSSMCAGGFGQTGGARKAVKGSGRRVSLLLTEALSQLIRLRVDAAGPALVLVAEIAIPAIGATEGRGKAIESLGLLWKEWLCQVRPLEYGAIEKLTRLAVVWYGGRNNVRQGDIEQHEDCPVMRMLEDLPLLGAEMVRHWARLSRTLAPVIGSPPASVGPFGHGGWASHVSNLHRAARALVLDLASSTADEPTTQQKARPATNDATGRTPLGLVKNSVHDKRKRGKAHEQGTDQGCMVKDPEGGKVPTAFARDGPRAEPCHDQLREVSSALPHTSAQVLVGIIRAAAEIRRHAKRAREVPGASVVTKRVKVIQSTPEGRCTTGPGQGILLEEIGVGGRASSSAWISRVLERMYGPGPAAPAVSSLGVLLETLVTELGSSRTSSGVSSSGDSSGRVIPTNAFESALGESLAVAILVHAPLLLAHLAEPPCLATSSSPTGPIERLGRSLVVLDILKLLLKQAPHTPGVWLTVALSHYIAALLVSMSESGHAVRALMNGRAWLDVVAFVHACVGDIAPQELRRLPAALRLAAQKVDPLLKQYL